MVFQVQGHRQALLGAGLGLDQQVVLAKGAQGQDPQVVLHRAVLGQAEWEALAAVVQVLGRQALHHQELHHQEALFLVLWVLLLQEHPVEHLCLRRLHKVHTYAAHGPSPAASHASAVILRAF